MGSISKSLLCLALVSTTAIVNVSGFSVNPRTHFVRRETNIRLNSQSEESASSSQQSRRRAIGDLFKTFLGVAGATTLSTTTQPQPALAAVDSTLESVYFGVGCFWHIQHEFVEAEKSILQRSDSELTSKAGYAGGKNTDSQGRVCYHNFQGVADYGKLGHGEVVGMDLPADKVVEFSEVYFSLFNPKTKERVDPQDRGAEYRSLIGLPGGVNHPLYPGVEEAATKAGLRLEAGKGNDPDTLGRQLVYVYDTAKFPFYQGEIYHQYHDDFQSPPYGKAYNKLANAAFEEGRLKITGCPDRV